MGCLLWTRSTGRRTRRAPAVKGGSVAITYTVALSRHIWILEHDRKVPRGFRTQEQALRVSWRIIKDWVEAQMAIVDTKMVQLEQVFLPYVIMPDGRTLYERVRDARFVLPPAETKET
jgi:hypothetical protein